MDSVSKISYQVSNPFNYLQKGSNLYQSQQLSNNGYSYPKFIWKVTLKSYHKSISKNRIKSFINQISSQFIHKSIRESKTISEKYSSVWYPYTNHIIISNLSHLGHGLNLMWCLHTNHIIISNLISNLSHLKHKVDFKWYFHTNKIWAILGIKLISCPIEDIESYHHINALLTMLTFSGTIA